MYIYFCITNYPTLSGLKPPPFYFSQFLGWLGLSWLVLPGLTHVAAFSWWVGWGLPQRGWQVSPCLGSFIFKEVKPCFFIYYAPRQQGVLYKCSSNIPAFTMFADVPVTKACHMAKPRVNMGGAYMKGMATEV